ncbi:MAG: nucleotidyltransferase domain-containing protein [Parabacteroides sp.]|nr:nucleotidyltransferase domain-containing protein [Parabacteroides sp.]
MKTDFGTMVELIKRNVHEVDETAQVWLYGSRARGEAREDSDWDILVLSSKDSLSFKEEEKFMDHICELMVKTGQAIQIFAYGIKDWHSKHAITPFYKNIQSEAILL